MPGKVWDYDRLHKARERDRPETQAELTAFVAMHHEKGKYWTDEGYRQVGHSARDLLNAIMDLRRYVADFRGTCCKRVRRHDRRAETPFETRVSRVLHKIADQLRPRIDRDLGTINRKCEKHNLTCKIGNLSNVRQLYTLRGPSGDTITL